MSISDYLSYGQENALPLKHLANVTGLDGREIRRAIERERRGGMLILSDNQHGYYLAANAAEAAAFTRSMRHRALEILRTARAIDEAAGIDNDREAIL